MQPLSRRSELALLIIITAAAASFHAVNIGAKPLWVDEAEAWWQATTDQTPATHPPLYFKVLAGTIAIAGEGEATLRAPSAVATAVVVLFVWWAVRALDLGAWYRLGAAAAAAASPFLLLVGQQARMYGVAALVGAAFTAAILAWRKRPRWPLAILAAAAATAGVYTVYSFWFIILGWLWLWPWRDKAARLQGTAVLGVVAAAFLPQVFIAGGQLGATALASRVGVGTWLAGVKAAAGSLFYFGAGFAYHPLDVNAISTLGPKQLVGLAIAAAAVLAPIIAAVVVRRDGRLGLRLAVFLATALGVNSLAPSGAEQMAAAFGAFVALWIWGLSSLPRRWRFVVAVAWAVTAGNAAARYLRAPLYPLHEEDWRAAGRYVASSYGAGDVVVAKAGPGGPAALAYYADVEAVDLGRDGLALPSDETPAWVERETLAHGRVFLAYGDWGERAFYGRLRALARPDFGVTAARYGAALVLFEFVDRRDLEGITEAGVNVEE